METKILKLDDYMKTGEISGTDEEKLRQAAELLRQGGLVAFPTETVYGLGGNGLLQEASRKIYAAKGRPSDNPLILHISKLQELGPIVKQIPDRARLLAEAFWPGPLTMIMEKAEQVPYETTGGLDTVAVRMPEHPVARRLIALSGVPVAAPSANTSGRPSPTRADHVETDLSGKIDAIVDGGPAGIGVESTIVDVSGDSPVLLRPGAVTREMLQAALSEPVLMDPALEKPLDPSVHPKAPGMKYRHYAPKAPMVIVQGKTGDFSGEELKRVEEAVRQKAKEQLQAGLRVGLICSEESRAFYSACFGDALAGEQLPQEAALEQPHAEEQPHAKGRLLLRCLGSHAREESAAHNLFSILREMDDWGAEYIVAEGVKPENIGYAIMNRMKKAAAQNILYV